VAGKARSIAIVAAPLAVIGPLIAAAASGEWAFLPAGFGVGFGALLAGTGAALVQSVLVPIAVPESDNPFAGGESGKGIVAAALLAVVIVGLAALTLPVALALIWATDRGNTSLVTLLGAVTVAVGWLALRGGSALATRRIARREPEFVAAVTPAR
jgi:ABC-2 type transport system permease protein